MDARSRHAATKELLNARSLRFHSSTYPGATGPVAFMPDRAEPLLSVRNLKKYFPIRRGVFSQIAAYVKAVDDIGFDINEGETFGLVGESGCGKTTAGRAILRLIEPDAGTIRFDGVNLLQLRKHELRRKRRDMQLIFQDPYASLNPRMTIRSIVGEPFAIHRLAGGLEREHRVADLLNIVGLDPAMMNRYPHEFSGGQRQRIGIARALALKPKLIVADGRSRPGRRLSSGLMCGRHNLPRAHERSQDTAAPWPFADRACLCRDTGLHARRHASDGQVDDGRSTPAS